MHNLKIATVGDLDSLLPLCKDFYDHSPYQALVYSETRTKGIVETILSGPIEKGVVITNEAFDGLIIATAQSPVFSEEIIASELAWWVNPNRRKASFGIQLIKAYIYWAEFVAKTRFVVLANLQDERLHKLYTKLGFTLLEQSYLKVIH